MSEQAYLVSSGMHSDYAVHCAFLDLDVALAYAARLNRVDVATQRRYYELTQEQVPTIASLREVAAIDRVFDESIGRKFADPHYVEARDLYREVPTL